MEKVSKNKDLGWVAKTLVVILSFVPTLWLVSEFLKDFLHDTEVVYAHSFLMGACIVLSIILLGNAISGKKTTKDSLVYDPVETPKILKQQAEKMALMSRNSSINTVIGAAWTLLMISLLKLFDLSKELFWVGLAVLIIFDIVKQVQSWRLQKPSSVFAAVVMLVFSFYKSLFWMVYAWAFGWGPFVAWTIFLLISMKLLCMVLNRVSRKILEEAGEHFDENES